MTNEPLPPSCADCDEHLVALLYDEAVPEDCAKHVKSCVRCLSELASFRRTRALVALPLESPSEGVDVHVLQAFEAHSRARKVPSRRNWRAPFALAASVAVVAGGAWLVSRGEMNALSGSVTETPQMFERSLATTGDVLGAESEELTIIDDAPAEPERASPRMPESLAKKAIQAPLETAKKRALPKPAMREPSPVLESEAPAAKAKEEEPREWARPAPSMGSSVGGLGGSSRARREVLSPHLSDEVAPSAPANRAVLTREPLAEAEEVMRRGDFPLAERLYRDVAEQAATVDVYKRAREGQVRALLASGRVEEAFTIVLALEETETDVTALRRDVEAARHAVEPPARPASE